MFIKTPKVSKYYIYKQDLQARNHYYNISRYTKTPDVLDENIRRFCVGCFIIIIFCWVLVLFFIILFC